MNVWLRMGFMRDGTISGKDLRVITDNGAYAAKGVAVGGVAALRHDGMLPNSDLRSELYRRTHEQGRHRCIPRLRQPGFRLRDRSDARHAARRSSGLDPLEVQLRNRSGAAHEPHGQEINSCEVSECIREAARLSAGRRSERTLGRIAASGSRAAST